MDDYYIAQRGDKYYGSWNIYQRRHWLWDKKIAEFSYYQPWSSRHALREARQMLNILRGEDE
jgi:hypothetical protein